VSPTGEHLLTASADGTVRLWEVATARCERTWSLGGEVRCVRAPRDHARRAAAAAAAAAAAPVRGRGGRGAAAGPRERASLRTHVRPRALGAARAVRRQRRREAVALLAAPRVVVDKARDAAAAKGKAKRRREGAAAV
jgi:hypothetical protein